MAQDMVHTRGETAGVQNKEVVLPTASALGLPWNLRENSDGFELNVTPVGWLFRILLDDTIGAVDRRKEGQAFLDAQREVAEFILRAANCHHDLLAALKRIAEGNVTPRDPRNMMADLQGIARVAIAEAEGLDDERGTGAQRSGATP